MIASGLGNPEVDLGMQNLNPEVSLGMQNLNPEVSLGMQNLYPEVDLGMKNVKAWLCTPGKSNLGEKFK